MGEPAQNAVWTTFDQLNPQAQKSAVELLSVPCSAAIELSMKLLSAS
jgi:hypothetical protein